MSERQNEPAIVPCVVIGGGEEDKIPALVTEYSIKARCPVDVEVVQTFDKDRPMFERHRNPTLFSLVRWWIPKLRNFQGRAIYLDSDMVVLDDIRKLFHTPMKPRAVLRTPDPSVMLIDCEHEGVKHWDAWKIRDQVDASEISYHAMWGSTNFTALEHLGALDDVWNHRDTYEEGATKNLHYTQLNRQPWRVGNEHPHEHVWTRELLAAIDDDFIPAEELPKSPYFDNIMSIVQRYDQEKHDNLKAEIEDVKSQAT